MPLQKQVIEVPFAKGVNEKSDPRWVQVGEQTSVLNGKWTKTGSLRKRFGFTSISKTPLVGSPIAAGWAVERYNGSHLVSDGANLYSYSTQKSALINRDQLPECVALRTGIVQSTVGVISADVAVTSGFTCYVYRATDVGSTARNYAIIQDNTSGAVIGPSTLDSTTTHTGLRVVASGTRFIAVWADSSNHLVFSSWDAASPTVWSVPITLISDMSATATDASWDLAPEDGTSNFLVVYQQTGTPNDCEVRLFNSSGSNTASGSFAIAAGSYPVQQFAIKSTSLETCWVAYSASDGVLDHIRVVGLNPSTLASRVADTELWTEATASTTRRLGVERVSSTLAVVVSANTGTTPNVSWRQVSTSAATVGPQRTQAGYTMWSKPLAITSASFANVYCMFYRYGDSTNQTYQLADLIVSDTSSDSAKARPVATIAPREATAMSLFSTAQCPRIVPTGTGIQYVVPITLDISTSIVGLFQATLDFGSTQRTQAVELGPCAYLAGGVPSIFDGNQVTEHGFLSAPILGSSTVTAGGSVDVGSHQYAVVLTYVNERGELSRSAPVFSNQITTISGSQTVVLQVNPYNMTTKQDAANNWSPAVKFDLYRNTISDPATFWKVAADSAQRANDPRSGSTITLTDSASDSAMTTAALGLLYTLGGVLSDECPPSLTCLTVHKNRIFGVGDDGLTLWFTKQYTTGFTPGFNDSLTLTVPEDGGVITGLASLDDHLVVFKRDRIFALYGTGPDATGSQSDFSDFVRIASDTGCTQSRSVVVAPHGVYFLSPQGIYLLTRGGEVVYAGRAIEDTVAANPTCLAADIVSTDGEIRWCLALDQFQTQGVVVSYDYVADSWGVHEYYDPDGGQSAVAMGAACSNGVWAWVGAQGRFFVENRSSFLDGSQWIPLQVETAWVKANGIAGWGRFWRATFSMEQATPFQATIDVATNYNDSYTQSLTFTDATIGAWTTAKPICSIMIGDQRTEAIRLRFTDSAPVTFGIGTGEGPRLLGTNVEVGVKPGTKGTRIPSAQRG